MCCSLNLTHKVLRTILNIKYFHRTYCKYEAQNKIQHTFTLPHLAKALVVSKESLKHVTTPVSVIEGGELSSPWGNKIN